uniref:Choline/carnitine acyltransferase domain-containing protein n=1 Tax=Calcidiscus leptoporus TaxID=127549 RepID=A0A7S0IZG6_9EUKA|mmetsp:Transcript_31415/g.73103  ORF Transcript_31415/g.73103 Transcript_31415/m.73103 type:complete len:611 (+) Transcript_31415:62-1894(+)|eukprot:CAMPEP_0119358060 /NCGR_PEP_ID=MMETSP1334-20130426/6337_1 /TAXON_ID=127549 /ORGANISM="Calcidiscus leptoporus, Strain RCC1130" /LENGTH=610 /DNA_ID=CAMNT_0007372467 /DNA_START=48 /DNA_END=1880 /DNA_ORIENTATION=+
MIHGGVSDRLFPSQLDLPPLPLPALHDTCERYLDSVRPLLSAEEYKHTEAVVADFAREGGDGCALQLVLEEKADTERNWMEEWWEQAAYLRTRTTMAVHINWFGVLPEWGFSISNVQAAAAVLHGIMQTRAMLEEGKLPLETLKGNPLDMHQFTRVFGMTRVPGEGCDSLEQKAASRHCAVLRRGQIFEVKLYATDGEAHDLRTLQSLISEVLAVADDNLFEQADDAPVSVLTSTDRDRWAAERARMRESSTNKASLQVVEEALFCLKLDTAAPASKQEVAQLSLLGDGRDVWYDKSFNAIVFANGRVGLNAEHTPVDAMTIVSLFSQALKTMASQVANDRPTLLAEPLPLRAGVVSPRKLKWEVDAPLRRAIELASADVAKLTSNVHLRVLAFAHFGKGLIKGAKLHPDFFIQMALQLAYFRLHGKCVATYETGTARAFFHGRTDTVRTVTEDSVAFVREMCDLTSSPQSRLAALRIACATHFAQLQRVLSGQGCDRHLLGLYIAALMRGEVPAIFTDKAYTASGGGGNYKLSTSNVGYTAMFGGFSPMTPDGYGVCYAMLEGRMNFSVTSWRDCEQTNSDAMVESITWSLIEMMRLCNDASTAPSSKL